MTIFRLQQTCMACPEQYEVLDDQEQAVGYVRLRHGRLTVEAPKGTVVFKRCFPLDAASLEVGDGHPADESAVLPGEVALGQHNSDGLFVNDEVRDFYLTHALRLCAEAQGYTEAEGGLHHYPAS